MNQKEIFSLNITKDDAKSFVSVRGVVPKEQTEAMRTRVLERLGKEKKIDGFREGAAPAEIVERSVGSLEVWRISAKEALTAVLPEILAEEGFAPLGSPQLQFTAIADRGDASFSMEFYTMPKVDLPEDYLSVCKQIEKPNMEVEAGDEDIAQVVTDIRKGMYREEHPEGDVPSDEEKLPNLTDAYVQKISPNFTTVEIFLQEVRKNITEEKRVQERSAYRKKLLDAIIKKTMIVVPEIVVEEEANRLYESFVERAKRLGTTVEEYLKTQKMSEEDLRSDMRNEARNRATEQFAVNAISAKEHIHANREEVEREVERMKKRGGEVSEDHLNVYIESLLTSEAVMQFLEKGGVKGQVSQCQH